MGIPFGLNNLLNNLSGAITLLFAATYEDISIFAGVGLALMIYSATFGFLIALSQTLTIVAGKEFGAKDYAGVSHSVQRSLLIMALFAVPVLIMYCFSYQFLLLIYGNSDQTRLVCSVASTLLLIRIAGIPAGILNSVLCDYLNALQIAWPSTLATFIGSIALIIIDYIFVKSFFLDYRCLGWAIVICAYVVDVVIIVCCLWEEEVLKTVYWWDWDKALSGWDEYMSLGIFLAISGVLEWIYFEIITPIAIGIDVEGGAALVAVLQLVTINSCIGYGVHTAVQVIICSVAGTNDYKLLTRTAKIGAFVLVSVSVFMAMLIMVFGEYFLLACVLTPTGFLLWFIYTPIIYSCLHYNVYILTF